MSNKNKSKGNIIFAMNLSVGRVAKFHLVLISVNHKGRALLHGNGFISRNGKVGKTLPC